MDNPILLLCIIAAALVLTLCLQDPDYAKSVVRKIAKAIFYAVGFLVYVFIYLPSYYLNRK